MAGVSILCLNESVCVSLVVLFALSLGCHLLGRMEQIREAPVTVCDMQRIQVCMCEFIK